MLCEEWEISSGASTEGLKKEGNWKFLLNEIRYKKIWDEKYIFLTFPELPPSPHLTLLWIPPLFFGYVSYFPRLCKNLERYLQWILCYLLLVLYDSKAIHMRRWTSPLWIREANFRECAGGIGWRRKREGWNEKWWRFFFFGIFSTTSTLRCVKIVFAIYTQAERQKFALFLPPSHATLNRHRRRCSPPQERIAREKTEMKK